jgi:hypothetical protein
MPLHIAEAVRSTPIGLPIRSDCIDFSRMTSDLVAVVTNARRGVRSRSVTVEAGPEWLLDKTG